MIVCGSPPRLNTELERLQPSVLVSERRELVKEGFSFGTILRILPLKDGPETGPSGT